jgi:hypothetical protein
LVQVDKDQRQTVEGFKGVGLRFQNALIGRACFAKTARAVKGNGFLKIGCWARRRHSAESQLL